MRLDRSLWRLAKLKSTLKHCKSKKFTLKQAMKAQKWSRCKVLLFLLTSALDGIGGQHNAPAT